MPTIERFEDLRVWQEARALANEIYAVSRCEPFASDWDLVRQIRRAATSILSNIAEGFERGSNTEFVQFLYVARASAGEVRSQLHIALDQSYLPEADFDRLYSDCLTLSRRLSNFIDYLKKSDYKGHKFKESGLEYFIPPSSEPSAPKTKKA